MEFRNNIKCKCYRRQLCDSARMSQQLSRVPKTNSSIEYCLGVTDLDPRQTDKPYSFSV